MKKNKFTLAIVAFMLFIGAGVYAMHTSRHTVAFDTPVWDYNGNPGGEDTASHYSLSTGTPNHVSCGVLKTTICQITAEPDPNNPNQPDLAGENPMDHQDDFQATLRGIN